MIVQPRKSDATEGSPNFAFLGETRTGTADAGGILGSLLHSLGCSVTLFAAAFLISCSASSLKPHSGLIERLRNRGPVALSTENPYLAANLLVSREMETSPEIAGFIKHRGAPAAIEVKKDLFSSLVMHFYYPENREEYELEDVEGAWIIRGPVTLSRDRMKQVAALTRSGIGAPKLADEETRKAESAAPSAPLLAPTPPRRTTAASASSGTKRAKERAGTGGPFPRTA